MQPMLLMHAVGADVLLQVTAAPRVMMAQERLAVSCLVMTLPKPPSLMAPYIVTIRLGQMPASLSPGHL
jgi:hypothetical protein